MTSLTKTQTATARNGKILCRVSIGGKGTRTLVIKSRQPKNGVKPSNSLGSPYAMLPFFLVLLFSPCSEIMKRETERC